MADFVVEEIMENLSCKVYLNISNLSMISSLSILLHARICSN